MSEIKALDKLREWSHHDDNEWLLDNGNYVTTNGYEPYGAVRNIGESLRELADEIQAEVDECYIALPTCADGVITIGCDIGNEHCHIGEIDAMTINADGSWEVWSNGNSWEVSGGERYHVKPRTIEDVLRNYACDFADSTGPDDDDEITKKYANEIRMLMGGTE